MEKQSNYWHISETDLKQLNGSMSIIYNTKNLEILQDHYNILKKFRMVPVVNEKLEELEKTKGIENLVLSGSVKFNNSPTDKYYHISNEKLNSEISKSIPFCR